MCKKEKKQTQKKNEQQNKITNSNKSKMYYDLNLLKRWKN